MFCTFVQHKIPNRDQTSSLLRFVDHIQLDIPGKNVLNDRPPRCTGRYLHNTQQTQETIFRVLSEFRSRNPSNRSITVMSLKALGTWISQLFHKQTGTSKRYLSNFELSQTEDNTEIMLMLSIERHTLAPNLRSNFFRTFLFF